MTTTTTSASSSHRRVRHNKSKTDSSNSNSDSVVLDFVVGEDDNDGHSPKEVINSKMSDKEQNSPRTDDDDDDEIEEEIEENISFGEDNSDPSLGIGSEKLTDRKRELFDFGGIPGDGEGTSRFLIDDEVLSGVNLAQHFQAGDEQEQVEGGQSEIDDSLEAALKDIDSEVQQSEIREKEKSRDPSPDDVILLNDQKISINSLKQNQQLEVSLGETIGESTTNDVSDLVPDDLSGDLISDKREKFQKSKSLDTSTLHPNITDRTFRSFDQILYETEEEIEFREKLQQSALEDQRESTLDARELSSLDPNINIEDESAMNKLLDSASELSDRKTLTPVVPEVDSLPRTSTPIEEIVDDDDEDDILNLKEKLSKIVDPIDVPPPSEPPPPLPAIPSTSQSTVESKDPIIKPMERIEYSKEVLEDISEESERTMSSLEGKKVHVVTQLTIPESLPMIEDVTSVIERGSEYREILQQMRFNSQESTDRDSFPIEIPSLGAGLGQSSSDFDSVISLNMFTMMEAKVRDLQDIIAGKDVCLAALNMQLEGYSRRESLKELPSSDRASSSLATSSTEYRTIQDDYVSKVGFDKN